MGNSLIRLFIFVLILIFFIGIANAIQWDNVAYWNLDKVSDSVEDITGNGHDGVVVGNPLINADGKINRSINFNYSKGNDNYVNTSDIDLKESVSYSLWIFRISGEDDTTYLSKRDRWGGTTIEIYSNEKVNFCIRTVSENSEKGWTPLKQFFNTLSRIFLGKDLKNYTFWGLTKLEHSCVSSPAPSLDEWHHIVAIYDQPNKNMSLYINGQYNSSTVHVTGLPLNDKNYVIGANAMGAEGFDGGKGGSEGAKDRIDEIGIWNRVLNYGEVVELYNHGDGLKYLD